jgi:hypothetical protein
MSMRSPGARPTLQPGAHARQALVTRCKVSADVGGRVWWVAVRQLTKSLFRKSLLSAACRSDEPAGAQWGSARCRNASDI